MKLPRKSISISLLRHCIVALSAFAFLAVPTAGAANPIEGCTAWFDENAETFESNQSGSWSYSAGVASREGDRILVSSPSAADDAFLRYIPASEASGRFVSYSSVVCFRRAGSLSASHYGSVAGVQIVPSSEDSSSYVFAVADPAGGWVETSVPAELDVEYVFTVQFTSEENARYVTYSYGLAQDGTTDMLASVPFSEGELPHEVDYSGSGTVATLGACYAESSPERYARWLYAPGIVTWVTPGEPTDLVSANVAGARYCEFKNLGDGWGNYTNVVYQGNGVTYPDMPGYHGAPKAFYYTLSRRYDGGNGYAVPGLVFRFAAPEGEETYAGRVGANGNNIEPFSLGGIIVEKGATGYQFYTTGTTQARQTELGDPTGQAETRFEFNEDFAIQRSGKSAGSETRLYGKIEFYVADGCTFSINNSSTSLKNLPTVLDVDTSTRLRLLGEGTLAVGNKFTATNSVMLDFSGLDANRATPYINGRLTVDAGTRYGFPSNLAENTAYVLCSDTFTCPAATVKIMQPVLVGTNRVMATLTYNKSGKSVAWSSALTPSANVTVPDGYVLNVPGSADPSSPYVWSGSMNIEGTLAIAGCVKVTGTPFSLSGKILIDGSNFDSIASDRFVVFTAPSGTMFVPGSWELVNGGDWRVSADGATLVATKVDFDSFDYADGRIVSWKADAPTALDSRESLYGEFDLASRADGAGEWKGVGTLYTEFPGYSGEPTLFAYAFCRGLLGWTEPGLALRFGTCGVDTAAGALASEFAPLSLCGILVEPGASTASASYSISSSGSGDATELGDPALAVPTRFAFYENFGFARGGETKFLGDVSVFVSEGKALSFSGGSAAVSLHDAGALRMEGGGSLAGLALDATAAATLDFSALSPSRATPFIAGDLAVSESTLFTFPAGASGSYTLCSGTLAAPSSAVCSRITVGNESFYAELTFNTAAKTVSWTQVDVNRATATGDANWSALAWNGGTGWKAGLPAVVTLEADSVLAYDVDWALQLVEFTGAHTGAISYTAKRALPRMELSGGASGELRIIGGSATASRYTWDEPVRFNGTLRTYGYVAFTDAYVPIDGELSVETGGTDFAGDEGAIAGTLVVKSGARFACDSQNLVSPAVSPIVRIYGSVNMRDFRWTFSESASLEFYGGALVAGTGGAEGVALDFGSLKTVSAHADPVGSEPARINAPIGLRGDIRFDIDADASMRIANPAIVYYSEDAVVTAGPGTLEFAGGEFASTEWVNEGSFTVTSGATLTLYAGKEGSVKVEHGGRLVLLVDDAQWTDGYWAKDVTLVNASDNVVFRNPAGAERDGIGNRLFGTSVVWVGRGDGVSWNDPANWSSIAVPVATNRVIIDSEVAITLSLPPPQATNLVVRTPVTLDGWLSDGIRGLTLESGAELTLTGAGAVGGVSGPGLLVKGGSGTLTVGNSGDTGVAVDGSTVEVRGGEVAFDAGEVPAVLSGATLVLTNGATALAGDSGIRAEGTLSINVLEDTRLFATTNAEYTAVLSGSAAVSIEGGILTLACKVGSEDEPYYGAVDVNCRSVVFEGIGSRIGGALSGGADVFVTGDLTLDSPPSYTGATMLQSSGEGTGVLRVSSDAMATESVTGDGTLVMTLRAVASEQVLSSLVGSAWTGTVWFRGVAFDGFNPTLYGNTRSAVRVTGCSGYFAQADMTIESRFEFGEAEEGYPHAFTCNNGYPGKKVEFRKVAGSGLFRLVSASGSPRYRVNLVDVSDFAGGITVEGEGNRGAVIVCATAEGSAEADGENDGRIRVFGEDAAIAPGMAWAAVNGIYVGEGAMLTDNGSITNFVEGSGIVRYTGEVGPDRIEVAAGYTNTLWTGTVWIFGANVDGASLEPAGNAGSVVRFSDSAGWFPAQHPAATIEFRDTSTSPALTVTNGVATHVVDFPRMIGDGHFCISTTDGAGSGEKFSVSDISGFEGNITIGAGGPSLSIGGARRSGDGALDFPDGFSIKSNRPWSADRASFGSTLHIDGNPGDWVMYITGRDCHDFSSTVIDVSGADPRLNYSLKLDGDTKKLMIASDPTPPTVDMSTPEIRYGADYTNVTVSVNLSNFWPGVGYEGDVVAQLTVRDSTGEPVATTGLKIDGDGDYTFRTLDLPGGRGDSFTYEITIDGYKSQYGEYSTIATADVVGPAVRWKGNWIDEDPDTFESDDPSEKTGDWIYPAGAAYTADGLIRVNADIVTGDEVHFRPYDASGDEVVRVALKVSMTDVFDTNGLELEDAAQAAVTAILDGDNKLAFGAWSPFERKFVPLYGGGKSERPDYGKLYVIEATFNYNRGVVCYSVDGYALTNSAGSAFLPISELGMQAGGVSAVEFIGSGSVEYMAGSQYNDNLAEISGNEFDTVDEAVEAAAEGDTINLLWDATWHPTVDMLGRTYIFDPGSFTLTADSSSTGALAARGYRLVDNGDNSYTIDLITYTLTYTANGGDGEDYSQEFTATNLVFSLLSNRFERVGSDFASWNMKEDGSGERSWSDGEEIDLSPYGLTNHVLHAQWKMAIRTVTIEPADEFVYLERVTTNGAVCANAKFFQTDAATGRGSATIEVPHGADVVLFFTTDIEKCLTFERVEAKDVTTSRTIAYADLPTIMGPISPTIAELIRQWAEARGISEEKVAASNYAESSMWIDSPALLDDETTVIRITDFSATSSSCTFKVEVNGEVIRKEEIANMVYLSHDLKNWEKADSSIVSFDDGTLTINADATSFVKLVFPRD